MSIFIGSAALTALWIPSGLGYEAEIKLAGRSVGAMPTTANTGQPIVYTHNTSPAAQPVISTVSGGPACTIASTAAAAQAGYTTIQMTGNVTKMSVDFVYQIGIHAWRDAFPSGPLTLTTQGAVCHLGFSPTGWIYAVWVEGSGLQTVQTRTYTTARSNTAAQHGEVIIDKATNTAKVTGDDGVQVTIVDARIGAYNCRYAQCEIYYNMASTEPRVSWTTFQATSAPGGAAGGLMPCTKVYLGTNTIWTPPVSVNYVGVSHVNANSTPAISGVLSGDLLITVAWQISATAPTLPAGWNNWPGSPTANNGSTAAYRIGYKYASAPSDTSGTWINSGSTMMFAFRNAQPGAIASNTGNSNTIGFPALTLNNASGSYGVRCAWNTSASDVSTGTITGYTNRATGHTNLTGKTSTAALTGNPTAVSQTVNASSTWLSNTFEVAPA